MAAILCAALGTAAIADPVPYVIVNGAEIPESLTGAPGDPARGAALFGDPGVGCSDCHGRDVGADLSPGVLRLWIVAPEARDPDVSMPAFYGADPPAADGSDPGGPRLSAAEVEDLVAYLSARAP